MGIKSNEGTCLSQDTFFFFFLGFSDLTISPQANGHKIWGMRGASIPSQKTFASKMKPTTKSAVTSC